MQAMKSVRTRLNNANLKELTAIESITTVSMLAGALVISLSITAVSINTAVVESITLALIDIWERQQIINYMSVPSYSRDKSLKINSKATQYYLEFDWSL